MPNAQFVDDNLNAVPVMQPIAGSDYETAVTGVTNRNTTAIAEKVVGLQATVDLFIKLGDGTVTAAEDDYDAHIPEGGYREYEMAGNTHIAAIKKTGANDGVLYINGLK